MYGEISEKAGRRHGVGPKGTRVNPKFGAQEEPFHGKQGLADKGYGRQRGTSAATGDTIDKMQGMGSPGRAGGKPSRGGFMKRQLQPTHVDHIDAPGLQKPVQHGGTSPAMTKGQVRSYPPGGGKKSPGSVSAGRPPARGAPPMQRAGRQTQWDGAAGRRP